MKKQLQILILTVSLLSLFSCNNDFLQPKGETLYTFDTPLELSSKSPSSSISLNIPDAGNETYYIRTQPNGWS